MTIQELCEQYYFHDSCITRIEYAEEKKELTIYVDFCYWAQEWYKKGDPQLMKLKVGLQGIDVYDGLTGDIDYFSILDMEIRNNQLWLSILDDFHEEYYEHYLSPSSAEVVVLGMMDD